MSLPSAPDESRADVEKLIVQAFGHSIIEFEAVLFHKFLILAGPDSVMTQEMFRGYLASMQSKGFVSPLEFMGKPAWKRLVIDTDTVVIEPSSAGQPAPAAEVHRPTTPVAPAVPERLVTESRAIARDIITFLKSRSPDGELTPEMRHSLRLHAEKMRRALSVSRDEFMNYVEEHLPSLLPRLEQLLNTKGEDILLLGLRMVEIGQ